MRTRWMDGRSLGRPREIPRADNAPTSKTKGKEEGLGGHTWHGSSALVSHTLFEVQGCTKRLFLGCVKSDEKVAFCLLTYCRQENAIFSTHFHTTWEGPFSAALYMSAQQRRQALLYHNLKDTQPMP